MNEKLIAARKRNNWSQSKAATHLEVDLRTYQRWERGESTPQPYYREKLCAQFGMTLEELGFTFQQPTITAEAQPLIHHAIDFGVAEDDRDWTSWFGIKLVRIMRIVTSGNESLQCDEIQTMVDQEIRMIDETLSQYEPTEEQKISRRQALVTIAALPLTLMHMGFGHTNNAAAREFLASCSASITSSWHLLRGNGLAAVKEILPQFTPMLRTLAQYPSANQQTAGYLAAQASILQAILAMHSLNPTGREAHCQEAIKYATISGDRNLHAAALTYLGYTYSFCYAPRQPQKAIPIFQKALALADDNAPLLKSNILMGMAEACAQCREVEQAFALINQAKDGFPTHPEMDATYIFGDCSLHVLYQWEGKTYLELAEHYPDRGYQHTAGEIILRSLNVQSISHRSTAETYIYRAEAARSMGELEEFTRSLADAVQLAVTLKSKKRLAEAAEVFSRVPDSWTHEPQLRVFATEVFPSVQGRKA